MRYDRAKQAMMLESGPAASRLREAIMACRNGGTVSVPGVYGGLRRQDPVRLGHEPLAHDQDRARPTSSATCSRCWSESRTARSIRASSSPTACRWTRRRKCYDIFKNKQDDCIKVVLKTQYAMAA